jgi:hypothetical protein
MTLLLCVQDAMPFLIKLMDDAFVIVFWLSNSSLGHHHVSVSVLTAASAVMCAWCHRGRMDMALQSQHAGAKRAEETSSGDAPAQSRMPREGGSSWPFVATVRTSSLNYKDLRNGVS